MIDTGLLFSCIFIFIVLFQIKKLRIFPNERSFLLFDHNDLQYGHKLWFTNICLSSGRSTSFISSLLRSYFTENICSQFFRSENLMMKLLSSKTMVNFNIITGNIATNFPENSEKFILKFVLFNRLRYSCCF